jgi:hypothetical protein
MLVLGVGVWIFSALKGYHDFTPGVPGHQEVWENFKTKEEIFSHTQALYRSLPSTMRAESQLKTDWIRKSVAMILERHEQRRAVVEIVLSDLDRIRKQLEGHKGIAQKYASVLIKVYRESNYIKQQAMGQHQRTAVSLLEYPRFELLPSPADDEFVKAEREGKDTLTLIERNVEQIRTFRLDIENRLAGLVASEIAKVTASVDSGGEAVGVARKTA